MGAHPAPAVVGEAPLPTRIHYLVGRDPAGISADNATFAKVRYRGSWFYIDDADLESKSTFSLLTYLFSIQASGSAAGGPLLTVSAGG